MVPRRKQTMISAEQPVRFYKFIALTFLFLTIILLSVIMFMSSKRAAIVIESQATPVDISDSILVSSGDMVGSLTGEVDTVLVSLEKTFYPTGTKEEESQARGVVMLHNDGASNQPLVATTRLLTPDNILFRIKKGVTVPAGGTVEVEVYAQEKGESGNISASTFTIPGLSKTKQKLIYATSKDSMTGGIRQIGILGVEDIKKAKEILLSDLQEKAQTELLDNHPGTSGVFTILQESLESDVEVGEEVSEFSLKGKATILGVFYNPEQLQELADKSLGKRAVDDAEFVQPSREAPTVTIEDYNLEKSTATLQVFHSGVAILNPESKQLDKSIFFGKTKDEVRRYLLKLDHVRSVEVKFTPAWIRTIPFVAEHVSVMVKEVE